nr:metallophosphoesterase [Candidatus Sigynarchaeum springense]
MRSSKTLFPLFIIVLSTVAIAASFITITTSARAILAYPRLGSPVRAPATTGVGLVGAYIEEPFSIWVGTDPADAPVPSAWLSAVEWHVGLVPNALVGAQGVRCLVAAATAGSSPFICFGPGDSSLLSQNAVRLDLRLPRSIQPGAYDLHVGFKVNPLADGPFVNDTSGPVLPGAYQGPASSASGSIAFTLAEPNCVYVPWANDSLPSSPVAIPGPNDYYKPWSLVHITDMHFGTDEATGLQLPSSAAFTDAVREAISIMAPDLVIMSGDLVRDAYDRPSEYRAARDWFASLGIPSIISNGNHDAGDMGSFLYLFGPRAGSITWAGTRITWFRTDEPVHVSASTASFIAGELHDAALAGQPAFLVCHVPLVDVFGRQTAGSAATILDALVRENGTALLQGHNHYNLVMDAATALDRYLAFGVETGTIEDACEFPPHSTGAVPPVDGPKLVITTCGGYDGRDNLIDAWPAYIPTTGYRVISMAGNRIANYTYDMAGDGSRDASYAQPVFDFTAPAGVRNPMLNSSLVYDSDNATFTIFNNLTESIPAARAAVVLPVNSTHRWQVVPGPVSIHERARFTNGTHEFIDLRLRVAAWKTVAFQLQFTHV